MTGDYPVIKIGEVAASISETHKFGKEELIFLNTSDILNGKFLHRTYSRVRDWPGQAKKSIRKDDILFSEIRPANGRWAYVEQDADDFVVSTKLMVIRAKQDRLFPRFLYQYLTSTEITKWLQHLAESRSGTFPQITFDQVADLELPLPPLAEQKRIAEVLGALDDKIELNRRMNATLEATARALFQSWFVDFDPVRAKLDGRTPSGMDAATAALFPDSFEESELGHIPRGWKIASIYEIANVIYGAPFASKQFNANVEGKPLIRIRDLADESPGVWTQEVHPKGYTVQPGDIVVGMDGEFRAYLWGGEPAWLNQRVCVFAPKPGYSAAFVRNSIIAPLAEVEATETATTVIHLGKNDIDRFTAVIPPPEIQEAFTKLCQPWYDQIVAHKQQSRTLSTLRDTLLPKLLSGELKVESHLSKI